jgi:cysteinyl-tRNA synthetase
MKKIRLFNTLTRKVEEFKSIDYGKVRVYCCGPTVYNYQHIGNMRTFLFEDILKRILLYNDYEVKHVMNITDVGHLVSDADEGEDKMEEGAKREGKTVWEISEYYTKIYKRDAGLLNIIPPNIYCKATDNIKEQIDLVKCLEDKGFTYKTSDGIYFDSSKFPNYGELAKLDIEGLQKGKRISYSEEKKNKTDFAVWKFSPKNKKRQMEWDSPWGVGFPGWHIECSAMSKKFLGNNFDIHCGGVDHINVHHTNEIAQSEACNGEKFANYWLHGEWLIEDKGKMSKSKGEFITLQTLMDKGYSLMHYRYFLLNAHYRRKLKFSYNGMDAAKNGYNNLKGRILRLKEDVKNDKSDLSKDKIKNYNQRFLDSINDDLNVTEGMAILWDMLKDSNLNSKEKLELALDFDKVFGLEFDKIEESKEKHTIPDEIKELVKKRKAAKEKKDFKLADEIREEIRKKGYQVVDKKEGVEINPI